jgi:hypothetical protein
MIRKPALIIIVLAIAVVPLLYNNCSEQTRFSTRPTANETVAGNPITNSAAKVVAALCQVISRCESDLTLNQCQSAIVNADGIDYQLGLTSGSDQTFLQIINAEQSLALVGNSAATDTCLVAIESLSCSDSSVENAYDPAASQPFSGVATMIPTTPGSCPEVFTPPPTYEYFVSTSGSDVTGDGSSTKPWATISHADASLAVGPDGATVHVAPGTYTGVGVPCHSPGVTCAVLTQKSGASNSARLKFISDQQWGAKIVSSGDMFGWYNAGDYVDIVGFDVKGDNASLFGVHNKASFVRTVGLHVHDVPVGSCVLGAGIIHTGATGHDNEAIGNIVHHIGPNLPDGLPSDSYCNLISGIYFGNPRGVIHNNIIYETSASGIETWFYATQMKITHNLLFNIGALTGPPANTFVGAAIVLGAGDVSPALNDYSVVANNIIRNNPGRPFGEYGTVGTNNVYLNNLLFANGAPSNLKPGTVLGGTVTTDPLMVNFQVDGSGDYRLTSTSPARDTGSLNCAGGLSGPGVCTPQTDFNGFSRPYGPGLDIGPYEWHP